MEAWLVSLGISSSVAGDILLFLFLIVAGLTFGLLLGRYRLINFLIAIYLSLVVVGVLPIEVFAMFEYARVVYFVVLVALLTLLDTLLFDIHLTGSAGALWRMVIMGFLSSGLLLSILIDFLPSRIMLRYLSPHVYDYFASPLAKLFWVVAPLAFLIMVNRRNR